MSLLLIISLSFCALLLWRLRTINRAIGELIEASRRGEPVLLDENTSFTRGMRLDQLTREFNRLQSEKASISGAGQAYHNQIQALLGNLREAVAMVDQDNAIISANPALRELTDSEKDPVGKRLDSLIQGTEFLEFISKVHSQGRGQLTEIKVRINQSSHWLEVSAAPLQEKSRKGGRYTLFIFHDITPQKRLEKMRTEFVANVSHELRTPVTIIKGFAETLIEDAAVLEEKEKKRFLGKISKNSDRLHHLLQDLLLLTRLESTEMVLQREAFSVNEFLHDFVDNWRSSHTKNDLPVELGLNGDITLEADPLRLNQVLNNLMENARRHAQGATQIQIRTECRDTNIVISVEDNGAGIPEKDLPHIFQRFFRVDKGRSRESGGTGLGLSIVKHIVAQHGGEINAHSRVGEGTRIDVILPVNREPGGLSGSRTG